MAWFAELAGKAENLLNNLDEQTGAALRNHNVVKTRRNDRSDFTLHPEPAWGQRKRPIPKNFKKITPPIESKQNHTPVRKLSPTQNSLRSSNHFAQESFKNSLPKTKKSITKKPDKQYTLDNHPHTMVGDIKHTENVSEKFGLRRRRFSLPTDLEEIENEEWTYRLQNLEVENVMLKNELNVTNQEVSELLDRLRKAEDGNDVDSVDSSNTELSHTRANLEATKKQNLDSNSEKESLHCQLDVVKRKVDDLINVEIVNHKERVLKLETELCFERDKNNELDEKINELTGKLKEKETNLLKFETELRHAQSTITDLQGNLEKSAEECQRLEKDWETYKLRVKSMLYAKDNEIKALQDGMDFNEETKVLVDQLDGLKQERDHLSELISRVRKEADDMKQYVEQLETRHNSAERVVTALRDALKEERTARNRAESQCVTLAKELNAFQLETGQTIAKLHAEMRDQKNELNHMKESTTSVQTSGTSALNVADFDVSQDSIDNDKVYYLTQTLVQKQGKIDSLLADNNMLRIQLDKIESKYKAEVAQRNNHQSVVNLQDGDCRVRRNYVRESALSGLAVRMSLVMKRYPLFRVLALIYMVGLHLFVFTVLLNNTPENYITRPNRS